jgi:hypothetical protein
MGATDNIINSFREIASECEARYNLTQDVVFWQVASNSAFKFLVVKFSFSKVKLFSANKFKFKYSFFVKEIDVTLVFY